MTSSTTKNTILQFISYITSSCKKLKKISYHTIPIIFCYFNIEFKLRLFLGSMGTSDKLQRPSTLAT